MPPEHRSTIRAIQHLLTTARAKALQKVEINRIAELLDQADHVCNLLIEESPDYTRIRNVLEKIGDHFPECSKELLLGGLSQ